MGFETSATACRSNTIAKSLQHVACLDWLSFVVIVDMQIVSRDPGIIINHILLLFIIHTPDPATLWSLRS